MGSTICVSVYSVLEFNTFHVTALSNSIGEFLSFYKVVQSNPDKYAKENLGIDNQTVTTIAFQDRFGRADSNDDLNVFLQISHTDDVVNSMRGVQLGGDGISVIVNGVDQGKIVQTSEIQMN
ncbi:hypothetical protein HX848_06940 [Marine Group I thaumarchaeote]|uniref:Uncharacterized protein n=1 Tax=Marine Group I thaumarchaeote TaxID=2511932 RepID=A0A7K4MIV2_9ARCH|nr:hypothetical protein [Marine Group I thaumarchaeote]